MIKHSTVMNKEEIKKMIQDLHEELENRVQNYIPITSSLEMLNQMLVRIYLQELCVITNRERDNEQCEKCEFIRMLAFMMDRSISEKILKSIMDSLDTLDYNLHYMLDSHYCPDCIHDGIDYFFKIQFRRTLFHKNTPSDWKEDVEDALSNLVGEYHASTHWEEDIFVITIEKRYDKDRM
jgi:hypothetical protein